METVFIWTIQGANCQFSYAKYEGECTFSEYVQYSNICDCYASVHYKNTEEEAIREVDKYNKVY